MSVNIYDPSTGLLAPVAGVNTALVNSKADKSTIAPVETNSTASQSYKIGEQFYYGGILRKATSPIAANDTITPGTNCDLSDEVSSQIYGLQTKASDEVTTRAMLGAHNLLLNTASTEVKNGVTFTINANKSVTVSTGAGGATANAIISPTNDLKIEAGNYIVSTGILDSKFYVTLDAYNGNTWVRTLGNTANGDLSLNINYSGYDTIRVYISVLKGGVYTTPKTAYPMIRLASDSDPTYQPYAMTNRELTKSVLYFTSVACAATTGNFATVSDSAITADHVVVECTFANPSAITSDVTWTTANGSLTLNGTCVTATTANIILSRKGN